jgi:nitrite reductase/ring-hydroxylating ferredoxin subunit
MSKIKIGSISDFPAGTMKTVDAGGTSVVIARDDEGLCAARNKCPHMGMALASDSGGQFTDGVVTCPMHNSRFVLRTGQNVDWATGFRGHEAPRWSQRLIAMGKKPAPLTTYPVTVDGDDVYVEI